MKLQGNFDFLSETISPIKFERVELHELQVYLLEEFIMLFLIMYWFN